MLKKLFKMIGVILLSIVVLIVLIGVVFVNTSPVFGKKASQQQQAAYSLSQNYKGGKFVNEQKVDLSLTFREYVDLTLKYFGKQPNTIPTATLPVHAVDSASVATYSFETPKIVWFGHSTVLLQIDGKNILIDPMFGEVPAPHPRLGTPRFNKQLPIEIEQLPQIDAVLISHDHYDHLDYESIVRLKDKVDVFYTPLGVGNHLAAWGVDTNKIVEKDWWEEIRQDNLRFICTPAQHFSGRGLTDRGATLWSSWIIQSGTKKIFFSGDSGYGKHFEEIGNKYGPFDFAMMECGQYNEKWHQIHMMPEETVQAAIDLKTKQFMPIHWGSFKLALHTWDDPVQRVTNKSEELGIEVITPTIGQPILLDAIDNSLKTKWWLSL